MAKLALTDLVNLQNENTAVSAINANNAAIETAMENTLSRDGTSPNQMLNDFDLNSHRILNADAFIQDVVVEVINDLRTADDLPTFSGGSVTITPEMFGSTGVYTTDEAAFLAMRNYTQAAGGVGVDWEFMPGKTYKVFGNPTLGTTQTLFNCNFATKGLKIKTNGCKFQCDLDWVGAAPNTAGVIFAFKDAEDLEIDRIEFINTVAINPTVDTTGAYSIILSDACRGIRVGPLKQTGGLGAIAINRSGTFIPANRGEGFDFELIETTNVYYPLSCQANGDYVKANINSTNAGRSYFPYNCHHHDINIVNNDTRVGGADQILLKVYTLSDIENTLEFINIKVKAKYFGTLLTFSTQQTDGVSRAATFRNISVHMDVSPIDTGAVPGLGLMQSSKVATNGTLDTLPRGHVFENIIISGSVIAQADTYPCALFVANDWTGDNIRGFGFRDFSIIQNSPATGTFLLDGRGITGKFIVENVYGPNVVAALTNIPDGGLIVSNTFLSNLKSSGQGSGPSANSEYSREDSGRLKIYGFASCTAGNADTVVTLPITILAGSGYVTGLVSTTSGSFDLSGSMLSSTTMNIHRGVTTGTITVFWEISAKTNTIGSTT